MTTTTTTLNGTIGPRANRPGADLGVRLTRTPSPVWAFRFEPGGIYEAELVDAPECDGHPAGPFDPMGETVYCDGTCAHEPHATTADPAMALPPRRHRFRVLSVHYGVDGAGVAVIDDPAGAFAVRRRLPDIRNPRRVSPAEVLADAIEDRTGVAASANGFHGLRPPTGRSGPAAPVSVRLTGAGPFADPVVLRIDREGDTVVARVFAGGRLGGDGSQGPIADPLVTLGRPGDTLDHERVQDAAATLVAGLAWGLYLGAGRGSVTP